MIVLRRHAHVSVGVLQLRMYLAQSFRYFVRRVRKVRSFQQWKIVGVNAADLVTSFLQRLVDVGVDARMEDRRWGGGAGRAREEGDVETVGRRGGVKAV